MKFAESSNYEHLEYPPGDARGYLRGADASARQARLVYWYGRLVLGNKQASRNDLGEYPWLLSDPRFHADMLELEDTTNPSGQYLEFYQKVRIIIELSRHSVEDTDELERDNIQKLVELEMPIIRSLCQMIVDGRFGDATYNEIAQGYISKSLASTAACYGQLHNRHPDLVADILPVLTKYYHAFACLEPEAVAEAWWNTDYGEGFDVSMSSRWLDEDTKGQCSARLEELRNSGVRSRDGRLLYDVLKETFCRTVLVAET